MNLSRLLPPQFLLPAWSPSQLHCLAVSCSLRSVHSKRKASTSSKRASNNNPSHYASSYEETKLPAASSTEEPFVGNEIEIGRHSNKIPKPGRPKIYLTGNRLIAMRLAKQANKDNPHLKLHSKPSKALSRSTQGSAQKKRKDLNQVRNNSRVRTNWSDEYDEKGIKGRHMLSDEDYLKAIKNSAQISGRNNQLSSEGKQSLNLGGVADIDEENLLWVNVKIKKPESYLQDDDIVQKSSNTSFDANLLQGKTPETVRGPKLSLLEELFPEEARKHRRKLEHEPRRIELPMLELPTFDELADDRSTLSPPKPVELKSSEEILLDSSRVENSTVLVLEGGQPDLCEADFRRISPKGTHIEEWRGPADPLKVIPYRNEKTLAFGDRYYLVFKNPALARAYQSRANMLHQLAQTHTPKSIESPLRPPPGVKHKGEDLSSLLIDYTLAPPSQDLHLRVIFPPYDQPIQRLLSLNGTTALKTPIDRASRCVLLWVDGYQPNSANIKHMLLMDSQDRGIEWGPTAGKGSVDLFTSSRINSGSSLEGPSSSTVDSLERWEKETPTLNKWLITLEDETEARRFVRAWHRRPYPGWMDANAKTDDNRHEPWPLVKVEFMW
jgi:hypothetical protein